MTSAMQMVADEPSSFSEMNIYADSKGHQNLATYFYTESDLLMTKQRVVDVGLAPFDV
jgi:hypothetical protein